MSPLQVIMRIVKPKPKVEQDPRAARLARRREQWEQQKVDAILFRYGG